MSQTWPSTSASCSRSVAGSSSRAPPLHGERRFLVPEAEYDPGRHGFVIDPARHEAYDGPSSFAGWAR
ncbi:MAG: hypothetical protein FJX45_09280 [Alphaproteobacteria bacterium]|nr:hypothetical protein [Alphaproteobacteria bacterium]MBM3652183.1 hypothetical protein [Alphaproteobacteria bacterium]